MPLGVMSVSSSCVRFPAAAAPRPETADIAAMTKIKGYLSEMHEQFDKDVDNFLSEEEVIEMLKTFGHDNTAVEMQNIANQVKSIELSTVDGSISFEAFQNWYIASETRIASETQRVFDHFAAVGFYTIHSCLLGKRP